VIKCDEGVAATFGDEASPLPVTGNFGIRVWENEDENEEDGEKKKRSDESERQ